MSKIILIKTGAAGDVLRTTTLLHLFKGDDITWITTGANQPLLPQKLPFLTTVPIENISNGRDLGDFDLLISLDDDIRCLELAGEISRTKTVGAFLDGEDIRYEADNPEWFDMSLISRFGKTRADELKKANLRSCQEMLFSMFAEKFNGEEYLTREDIRIQPEPNHVGIEKRAGVRWPSKAWHEYDRLAGELGRKGYRVTFFEQKASIKDYMADIARCSAVVSGDSLAMHVALAFKIPAVAIFTVTSATEIYGYGRLRKIVSPLLNNAFYTTEHRLDVLESISFDDVLEAVDSQLLRSE